MSKRVRFSYKQLSEIKNSFLSSSVFDGAAALAFYLTLAIIPGLIFTLTLLPYLPLPDLNAVLTHDFFDYLPPRTASTLQSTLLQILEQPNAGLLSLSFLGGLYAASSGTTAIMKQINIAYKIKETRPFLKTHLTSIALTLLLTAILLSALLLIIVGGMFVSDLLLTIVRWIVMISMVYSGTAVIYHFAPNTKRNFQYFSAGSTLATSVIIVSTGLLSLYSQNVSSYNRLYGGLAGIMFLMVWLYLIGMAILMGAHLNHLKHVE